jgi:hypothetical protein
MPKQPAFPVLRDAMKKKQTRREVFLSDMEAVVPWGRLLGLITPHYPKAGPKGGRPPPVMLLCLSMGAYGVFGRAKFTIDFANDVAF